MDRRWLLTWIAAVGCVMSGVTYSGAQSHEGQPFPGRYHEAWPDSLQTVSVSGTVIVESFAMPAIYWLDTDGDAAADYHLDFGPWWYEPTSGAVRPTEGASITVVGLLAEGMTLPNLIVFELDGELWRQPVELGPDGWNGQSMWQTQGDTMTVTGKVLIDSTYFYAQFFLDTNNDTIPDFKLGFGPPWYEPASGAVRPEEGQVATVFGRVHDLGTSAPYDLLAVYVLDGLEWQSQTGPANWAGTWMHRNHPDTVYAYCASDSLSWVGFPPGGMSGSVGMGGMMWPESLFVKFWVVFPDSLPGPRLAGHFLGFYLDADDSLGQSMMGRAMGWHDGMMRFNTALQFRFHYEAEMLHRLGAPADSLRVHRLNAATSQWEEVANATVDFQTNTVSFADFDLSSHYALFAAPTITGITNRYHGATANTFTLHPNFPNPFNPATTIRFDLPARGRVRLAVYNLLGQQVALLLEGIEDPGTHLVRWDGRTEGGRAASTGIYLVRLETEDQSLMRRITLLK